VEPSLAPVSIVLSPEEEKVRVAGGRLLLTVKGFDRGFSPLYRQSWAPTSGRSIPQRLPPTSARRELAGSHGLSPCRRLFRTDISMPRFAHSSAPASGHNQRSAPRPDSICAVPLLLCLPHLQIVRQDSKSPVSSQKCRRERDVGAAAEPPPPCVLRGRIPCQAVTHDRTDTLVGGRNRLTARCGESRTTVDLPARTP